MRIASKTQMYALLASDQLGNHLRVWGPEEYQRAVTAGFTALVGVRCVGKPGLPYYHLATPEEALEIGSRVGAEHSCQVRFCESSPDQHITIQGAISDLPWGYVVEYSTKKTHMRAALEQECLQEFSPRVPSVIRQHFDQRSIEDMLELFEIFPGATAEFTAYEVEVGVCKGRRVIWWEWRHY